MMAKSEKQTNGKNHLTLAGVVIGGIIGIFGGLFVDYAREFIFNPIRLDKQIKWMLALDAERLGLLISDCDAIQYYIPDAQIALKAKILQGAKFLFSVTETDFYERYEPFHTKISDVQTRRIISALGRLTPRQTQLRLLIEPTEKSIKDVVSSNYSGYAVNAASMNLQSMLQTTCYVKEQSVFVLLAIQNLLQVDDVAVLQLPYEFRMPSQYLNYGTSVTARSFKLSISRQRELGMDSVRVSILSFDSVSCSVHDLTGWKFLATICTDSVKL